MKPSEAQPSPQGDDYFFRVTMMGVIGMFLYKGWLKVVSFYQTHTTRAWIAIGLAGIAIFALFMIWIRNWWIDRYPQIPNDALMLGTDTQTRKVVFVTDEDRTVHMQVIGTTRSGKTYYVVGPVIAHDIKVNNGCIIVDGKSDRSFSNFIDQNLEGSGRKDTRKLLLANPKHSGTYNPFYWGTPDQITERFFSAFTFDNPFYKAVQFNSLRAVLIGLEKLKQRPTPFLVHAHLSTYENIKSFTGMLKPTFPEIASQISASYADQKKYQEYHAGLNSYLSQLCMGDVASIFNTSTPSILLEETYKNRSFLYAQIPTMQFQTLGPAVGRLILLELMQVISVAQVQGEVPEKLLSVILDDFNDFMFEGFGSLLNKGRSGKVGVIFSHQSMGDLDRVSPHFRNIVLTNTNIKVVLKTPDPDSAETLSRLLGTKGSTKKTERVQIGRFSNTKTGEASEREVEEFNFHPNVLKTELAAGEGIVLMPNPHGTEVKRVDFRK